MSQDELVDIWFTAIMHNILKLSIKLRKKIADIIQFNNLEKSKRKKCYEEKGI